MDELAKTFFRESIYLLRHYIAGILLKKDLRDPQTKKPLSGYWNPRKLIIFIDKNLSEEEKLQTLIHELEHVIFGNNPETQILKTEIELWYLLTKNQKNRLRKYIPKYRRIRKLER
ncbi:MAG: ImmA/IrrE family metallo-endopeptidase [Candidatus Harrisonbacteria bacterium]|nr:ImmA/IrrE family metallo-endopeptidase [Candidatus Harrisonbacteria bacterium]